MAENGGEEMGSVGNIDLSNRESAVDLTGRVHQLPCCIKYSGPCSVSDYFKPKCTDVEVDGLSVNEAYFRGRKLQGTTIPLPQGYSGFVIGKKKLSKRKAFEKSEEDSGSWEMNAKFRNITVWNHDSLPSQDDAFLRSFHWLVVAKAAPSATQPTPANYNSQRMIVEDLPAGVYIFIEISELHQPVTAEDLESTSLTP